MRKMVQDLAGNEARFIQRATSVEMTMVNGEMLVENNSHTGALPEAVYSAVVIFGVASGGLKKNNCKEHKRAARTVQKFTCSKVQGFRNRNILLKGAKLGLPPFLPRDAGEDRGGGLNRA
jgi:hypothetical protein